MSCRDEMYSEGNIERMYCLYIGASFVAQIANNKPVMQETWVLSLHQHNPLENSMDTIPVFLPGKCHGQRSLVGYSPWCGKELGTTETPNTD